MERAIVHWTIGSRFDMKMTNALAHPLARWKSILGNQL
jgi:hypothetical protein